MFSHDAPPFYRLKDGTLIPNFAHYSESDLRSQTEPVSSGDEANFEIEMILREQGELMAILDTQDDPAIIPELKLHLLNDFIHSGPRSVVFRIVATSAASATEEQVKIPWPPFVPGAEEAAEFSVKDVKLSVARRDFFDKLSPNTKASLAQFAEFYKGEDPIGDSTANSLDAALREVSQTRRNKVRKLFEETRENLMNRFLGGRPYKDLNEAEKAVHDKLASIRLMEVSEEADPSTPECLDLMPNAFYSPKDHQVALCPTFYNLPNANLAHVMAHEMCHSIDPCHSHSPITVFNEAALSRLDERAKREQNDSLMESIRQIKEMRLKDGQLFGSNLEADFGGVIAKQLRTAGVFKTSVNGMNNSNYPFKPALECFSNRGFRRATPEMIADLIETSIKTRRGRISNYNEATDRKNLTTALNLYPECIEDYGLGNSEMSEVFADWCGNEALKEYVRLNPPKTEIDRLAIATDYAVGFCEDIRTAPNNSFRKSAEDLASNFAHHPEVHIRWERILLSDPEIRSALKCSDFTKATRCEYQPQSQDDRSHAVSSPGTGVH